MLLNDITITISNTQMSEMNREFIKKLHELRHHYATVGDEATFKMYDDKIR